MTICKQYTPYRYRLISIHCVWHCTQIFKCRTVIWALFFVRLFSRTLPYSRKLLKEITCSNFTVLWLFAKVFSAKFGDVVSFGMVKASTTRIYNSLLLILWKYPWIPPFFSSPDKTPAAYTEWFDWSVCFQYCRDREDEFGLRLWKFVNRLLPKINMKGQVKPGWPNRELNYHLIIN